MSLINQINELLTEVEASPNREASAVKQPFLEAKPESTLKLTVGPGKYFITTAQNNTDVDTKFFKSILKFCETTKSQLLVLPIRYKNVSAYNLKAEPYWDTILQPYYLTDNVNLTPNLVIKGNSRIAATASDPLSGWNVLGEQSAVYGHNQQSLKTIPSPSGVSPSFLITTGSITVPNYSNAKMGELAFFHHNTGGLILTVHDDVRFDYEHVAFKDGGFYCMEGFFTPSNSRPLRKGDVDDIVLGDWHSWEAPSEHKQDAVRLVKDLKPKRLWLHDVLSFLEESHHVDSLTAARESFPTLFQEAKLFAEEYSIFDELTQVYVVNSNHDNHIDKWLMQSKFNNNNNRLLYHMLWVEMLKHPKLSSLQCLMRLTGNIEINHPPKEGFLSHGIEMSLHGDKAANGAKGSVKGFSRLTHKTITGHGHSPEWYKGSMRTGTTGPLNPTYSKGYNSMALAHAIVYKNGARTLISRSLVQVCRSN